MAEIPPWTTEQKLEHLMRLPWTIRVELDEIDQSLFASVEEIPDAVADADDEESLGRELWESLSSSLMMRLEHEDQLPRPAGVALPWEIGAPPPTPRGRIRYAQDLRMVAEPTTSATTVRA